MNIGDKVFIKTQGNEARYSGSKIIEGTIISIGRKYVTIEFGYRKMQFNIDSREQKTDYCKDFVFYNTKEEILEEIEINNLYAQIKQAFSGYINNNKYSIEELRSVRALLK